MVVPAGHKEFFGDGSGNALALTVNFVAGTAIQTYTDSELILNVNVPVGVTPANFIELQLSIAQPGSTTWQPMPVAYGDTTSSDTVIQQSMVVRVPGTVGDHPCVIKSPSSIRVRIDARRNGGAADTSALITGYVRDVVGESSISSLSQVAGGAFPLDVNVDEIADQAIATTGINGTLPIEGTRADDATADASQPVKIGAVADEVPSTVADGDQVHLIADLERNLWSRLKTYDPVTGGDFKTNLNLDSTNHDVVSTAIINTTNLGGPGTHYAPAAAGQSFGDRNKTTWVVGIRDVDFDLEVSNDGTNWGNATASLVDHFTDRFGYDNTHFTEPDAATVYFTVSFDNYCGFRLYRFVITTGDATNVVNIYPFNRAV